MPIHNLTKDNEIEFYCRNCDEKVADKEGKIENSDSIQYRVVKCACGNESGERINFHRRSFADGEGAVGELGLDTRL